jgi:hypothetical protein
MTKSSKKKLLSTLQKSIAASQSLLRGIPPTASLLKRELPYTKVIAGNLKDQTNYHYDQIAMAEDWDSGSPSITSFLDLISTQILDPESTFYLSLQDANERTNIILAQMSVLQAQQQSQILMLSKLLQDAS